MSSSVAENRAAPSSDANVNNIELGNALDVEAIKGFDVAGGEAAAVPTAVSRSVQPQKRALELGIVPFEPEGITFNLLRAALAEAIATAFFLFLTITTIQYTVALGAPGVLDSSKHFIISMTFGLSIFVLVYMFFSVSGGHINPAVTFCLMLGKRVSGVRALLYIIAQTLGACLGAVCAKAVSSEGRFDEVNGGINSLSPGVSEGKAFFGELLCTALLCLTVLAATSGTDSSTNKLEHQGALLPFAIGMTVAISHFVMIPIDNCSINPARSFGASAVAGDFTDHWVFWVGPLCGSVLAITMWEGILRPPVLLAPAPEPVTKRL